MRWAPRWAPTTTGAVTGVAVGLLVLGPALAPGFLLRYDMVFVPEPNFGLRALGLDGALPRAVPNDFLVSVLSVVLPGWFVQKLLLLAIFALAGGGVGRLCPSRVGAAAAAVYACWNPYVYERMAIGHWGFLLGYATIPWIASAAARARRGEAGGHRSLALWLVVAAATGSTSALFAVLTAVAVILVPARTQRGTSPATRSTLALVAGVSLLANAPWWLPALVRPGGVPADVEGVAAFASRADTDYGSWGSLITGGGIWNPTSWPPERGSLVVAGLAVVGTVVSVAFLLIRLRSAAPGVTGLVVAGGAGLVLAAASGTPLLSDAVEALVTEVPGGGLVRDSQKFLAPWVVVVAVAVGTVASAVWGALRRRTTVAEPLAVVLTVAAVAWPVVSLPSLAWGAQGRWQAVSYPEEFTRLADEVDAAGPSTVAVFPWVLYRRYEWNDDTTLLDPWQRLLDSRVLVNDDLPLSTSTVRGEDPDARAITRAVEGGAPGELLPALEELGVRFVVLHTDQPGSAEARQAFDGLTPVREGEDLVLYELEGRTEPSSPLPSRAWLGLATGMATTVGVIAWWGHGRWRVRRARGGHPLDWSSPQGEGRS